MRSLARRTVISAVIAALMILMIPAFMSAMGVRTPGIEEAHAGGSVDLGSVNIHGTNTDGTVYNGEEIYASAKDLADAYGMTESEFTTLVKNGKVGVIYKVYFYKSDDTSMQHAIDSEDLGTTFNAGAYRTAIEPSYYPHDGVFAAVQLFTSGNSDEEGYGSGYNNNTGAYKIVDRFVSKSKLNTSYAVSCTIDTATLTFMLDSLGTYRRAGSSMDYTAYDTVFRFFNASNKEIGKPVTTNGKYPQDMTIPISFGDNKITVAIYSLVDGKQYFAGSWTLNIKSATLGKNTVYATKISSKQAIVRWSGVSGAAGYYIYQGSKKIKTVKSTVRKATIKRKGAGKAKFKVVPYVKASSKTYKGTSAVVKPKSNVYQNSISKSYESDGYGKGSVRVAKISGSGSKYTATLYAYNNRMFKLVKYKKITLKVYADGKFIGKKTIKNKKVNMKKYSVKKIVLKFKGKVGDLRHGTVTYSISYDLRWENGIKAF